MKRIVLLAAAAGLAYLAWKKAAEDREARALWGEVTDAIR